MRGCVPCIENCRSLLAHLVAKTASRNFLKSSTTCSSSCLWLDPLSGKVFTSYFVLISLIYIENQIRGLVSRDDFTRGGSITLLVIFCHIACCPAAVNKTLAPLSVVRLMRGASCTLPRFKLSCSADQFLWLFRIPPVESDVFRDFIWWERSWISAYEQWLSARLHSTCASEEVLKYTWPLRLTLIRSLLSWKVMLLFIVFWLCLHRRILYTPVDRSIHWIVSIARAISRSGSRRPSWCSWIVSAYAITVWGATVCCCPARIGRHSESIKANWAGSLSRSRSSFSVGV